VSELLDGPNGQIDWLATGSGDPVTIFAHGLAASIAQTRPLASGVPGTRVFLSFRGHGATTTPDPKTSPWTYATLADELRAVADDTNATRALGLSMGSHALLSLVATTPDRFQRLVFVLPLREMPAQVPLPGGVEPLRQVTAPALVIAQAGDEIHPVAAAERLAKILPNARLEVLEPGGVLWRDRVRLRGLVAQFLAA
jgi:pimeloyl-ACP methyl ester carboxylesterase